MESTQDPAYAQRLEALEGKSWKRILDVQAPYRWNLRRLNLGLTLDVGCGLGRNLMNLGNGVGVDHNARSVSIARSRGLIAFNTQEWKHCEFAKASSFDSILLSHVLEHMESELADEIIESYQPYLKPSGKLVLICPQEKGFPTDPTHIRWVDEDALRETGTSHGFNEIKNYSFPFPRVAGKLFTYNEFVYVGVRSN